MRKLLVMVGLLMTLILSACGGKEPKEEKIRYAKMIPDPKEVFVNGDITITDPDGGKAYIFTVENFETSEYDAYVEGCMDMGFDDVRFQLDDQFGAYTSDGAYWVQTSLEGDIIYVICQKSRNYEEQ